MSCPAHDAAADELCRQVRDVRQPGDLAIVSAHWGGNWGYRVEPTRSALPIGSSTAESILCMGTPPIIPGLSRSTAGS